MKSRPITGASKRNMFINDVFGSKEELIKQVREMLDIPDDADGFLTDEIITADLHIDVAVGLSVDAYGFVIAADDDKAQKARLSCLYRLCGSICHALSSRVKDDKYAAYRDRDWLKASANYQYLAVMTERSIFDAR